MTHTPIHVHVFGLVDANWTLYGDGTPGPTPAGTLPAARRAEVLDHLAQLTAIAKLSVLSVTNGSFEALEADLRRYRPRWDDGPPEEATLRRVAELDHTLQVLLQNRDAHGRPYLDDPSRRFLETIASALGENTPLEPAAWVLPQPAAPAADGPF